MNEETTTSLIDTALASGSATAIDPEERRLQELVLAIRDDVPTPEPDFELRMNARVAAGFPASRRRLRRPGWIRMPAFATRRPQLAALGAAASVLIALVVVVSVGNDAGRIGERPVGGGAVDQGSAEPAVGGAEAVEVAPGAPAQKAVPEARPESAGGSAGSGAAADSVIAPPPVPPGGSFVGGPNRRVERSAALVLAAPKDELNDVGDRVIAVTDRYRGIVMRSSITTSEPDEASTGYYDLRIPVRSLSAALRDISALADVQSRTENADDVTASFVGARTRLQELGAERRGLLRRLERAETEQAAAAIRARIRLVNQQIEEQTRVLAEMRRRTSYATVSVTLQAENGDAGGGIGEGARDLRDSLVDAANLGLRVLGVAIPLALVAGLLWVGTARLTRRRREAALD